MPHVSGHIIRSHSLHAVRMHSSKMCASVALIVVLSRSLDIMQCALRSVCISICDVMVYTVCVCVLFNFIAREIVPHTHIYAVWPFFRPICVCRFGSPLFVLVRVFNKKKNFPSAVHLLYLSVYAFQLLSPFHCLRLYIRMFNIISARSIAAVEAVH